MLESLRKSEQDKDEYQRRASKARTDAQEQFRADVGVKCDVSLYIGKLYGSVGSIDCNRPHYESIDTLPAPNAADVNALLNAFVPVPLAYRKGTFTTIRPVEYSDGKENANDRVENVAPIVIRIKPGQYAETEMQWYGKNAEGEIWRVNVELPYQLTVKAFGKLDLVYDDLGFGRDPRIIRCNYQAISPFRVIKWGTGEWSGDHKTPNEFTVYAPIGTDVVEHVRKVLEAEAEAERLSTYRTPTPRECLQSFADYLHIDLETAAGVRRSILLMHSDGIAWETIKAWFADWVTNESGTTETLHPVANSWYQLAGALPEHGGEKYHAANSKRNMNTPRPADGGEIVE